MASTAKHDPYEIQTPATTPATTPAMAPAPAPAPAPAQATTAAVTQAATPAGAGVGTASETGTETATGGGNRLSVVLWTLAAILAGANTALSIAGYPIIGSFAGGGVLGCLTVLLVRYLRRRR